MNRNIILIVLLGICSFAEAQFYEVKRLYVAEEKTRCVLEKDIFACYKVRTHPDSLWQPFSYEIKGFEFVEGVQSLIEVKVTENSVPDRWGQTTSYELVRVIEKRNMILNQKELLRNNEWQLLNVQLFTKFVPFVIRSKAKFVFNVDSSYVTGFAGCNNFTAKASYDDGSIIFADFLSTAKSCQYDTVETLIKEVLSGASAYYVKNGILYLAGKNGGTLHFRPKKRLDSLIRELSKPKDFRGNTFTEIGDGVMGLTLDGVEEANKDSIICSFMEMTDDEKTYLMYKLSDKNEESPIAEIWIRNHELDVKDYYNAEIIMRNGTRKTVLIKDER